MDFRPLASADLPTLADWLGRPHVLRWWREAADIAAVEAAYGPMIDSTDPTEGFVAVLEGRSLGFIQRYRLDDNPEWEHTLGVAVGHIVGAGIDYLIGDESMTGQGLGRQMISRFVDDSWTRYPDIVAFVVAVQQDNRASWRALGAVGFRRAWGGTLDSDDPSDQGLSYVYVKPRSGAPGGLR
jgi:aminoglycoside 6'-N-acetyltransferase